MDKKHGYSLIINEQTLPIIQQISERMPGGFFIYHADGDEELIYINSSMLRIFGCESEEEFRELTGFTFRGLVHPEDIDVVEESITTQINGSKYDLDYVEYRIIQKNGSIRWVEDYGHFLNTKEYGDIFCVFIEDATARLESRMTELEQINYELRNAYLRESQYKKAILYDAVSFFEVNLTKDKIISTSSYQKDNSYQNFNREYSLFETVLYEPQPLKTFSEFLARKKNFLDAEDILEFNRFFDRERLVDCAAKGEMEQAIDMQITDQAGRKRVFRYIMLLGEGEDSQDVVALFMAKDITDQVEKQMLLKQALRQAETANMARSIFLSNMSHDIRTPLNAIIGYTDLIKQNLGDREKVNDFVNKIRTSGEQLLKIFDESLQVTRMESGKVDLTRSECTLTDILHDVEEVVRTRAGAKNLSFMVEKKGVIHDRVIADYIRIKEILGQLLDNAVKYSHPGGAIGLILTEEENDLNDYGDYKFIVVDNGIGISEDFAKELFEPFKRENNTTFSGVLGTGLGLTVVKSLVDLMGGEISVESKPAKGSRFTVKLPLKLQESQEKMQLNAEEMIDQETLKGKRILLVEDNEINSEIAKELLEAQGYIVETAENGQIALDRLEEVAPDYYLLILMDIQMPIMDGYEATKRIREMENKEIAGIPIIALSANAFAEDYYNSLKAGMDAHFPKPLDIGDLQKQICSVLSMRRMEGTF